MQYQFRNNKVYLYSDSHSLSKLHHLIRYTKDIQDSDIVVLGDSFVGVYTTPATSDAWFLNKINNAAKGRNINLFLIRGNADNYDIWFKGYEFSNVFLCKDYSEALFPCGVNALMVGGAVSLDRHTRKNGWDWWSSETTIFRNTAVYFDILFCHDAPSYFNKSVDSLWEPKNNKLSFLLKDQNLYIDCQRQRKIMDKIAEEIQPRFIFGGHYHNSVQEEYEKTKYRCIGKEELFCLDATNLS